MKKNLDKVAKREKLFSTLAHKEGEGAKKRASTSTGANKKDNEMEAELDEKFAKKRMQIAIRAKRRTGKS